MSKIAMFMFIHMDWHKSCCKLAIIIFAFLFAFLPLSCRPSSKHIKQNRKNLATNEGIVDGVNNYSKIVYHALK